MCGIAGYLNFDGVPASSVMLRRMTDAIRHRGPDDEGFYFDNFLALGHRRLSILDLSSAGHQPMHSKDGQIIITYNGEIYNFQELRTELEVLGYQFCSTSDTEVLLYAYMEWSEDCIHRFNGMFAFAIWDRRTQELFLARDRYGIKPLYYAFFGQTFLFASEQKAILEHEAILKKLDQDALVEYFTFQNIFTDKTFFQNIQLLPAGCYMRVGLDAYLSKPHITRYWDWNFVEPLFKEDSRAWLEELNHLFQQAVKRQLISDVEIGTFLSGGIDSGGITAVAATGLPNIKTFCCGFDLHSASGLELCMDEREEAELLSYLYKTEHYEIVLKSGDMERIMPVYTWHLEEPRVGQSYPNFYVSQLASKFVKVCLAGTGGDEVFGGYPWRYYRATENKNLKDYFDKYYNFWQRLIPNSYIKKVFTPALGNNLVWTRDIFEHVYTTRHMPETPQDYINMSLYFEAKTFLHGLLVVEDKLSMAHGLEIRVPFLDNDLVNFAMQMPVSLKLGDLHEVIKVDENLLGKREQYFQKSCYGKFILRSMLERYVPQSISSGVKRGFSAPDASWFRGESIDFVQKLLFSPQARLYDYMDRTSVQELVNDHMEGKINRRLLVWSLINFEWWLRTFM